MASDIARYYDSNTSRFLAFGRGGESHAIHRELWGPGVTTAEDASRHVNVLIEREIRDAGLTEPLTVLDMGCGVGGTTFHLARRFSVSRFVGITISRKQLEIATRLGVGFGLGERCHFVLGDFEVEDLDLRANAVVAVESFVHATSPRAFLAAAAGHLRDSGVLIVVDDFLTSQAPPEESRVRRRVGEMKSGWRLSSLCSVGELRAAAERQGLEIVKDQDLTSLVRLGRARDRLIGMLAPTAGRLGLVRLPFFGNLIGGNALQIGLREGFLQYRLIVLERTAGA
jgi:membrane glycosyltransferase